MEQDRQQEQFSPGGGEDDMFMFSKTRGNLHGVCVLFIIADF